MTQDEIIRMAVECQLLNTSNREGLYAQAIERFAALVAAHEREKQAEQEPVAWRVLGEDGEPLSDWIDGKPSEDQDQWESTRGNTIQRAYTHPVRTKDLTDDEIMKINVDTASIVPTCDRQFHFARAVITADREKNK